MHSNDASEREVLLKAADILIEVWREYPVIFSAFSSYP